MITLSGDPQINPFNEWLEKYAVYVAVGVFILIILIIVIVFILNFSKQRKK